MKRIANMAIGALLLSGTGWFLHSWNDARQSREDFVAAVTAKSEYDYITTGWNSRTFAIVTVDMDEVACDGFIGEILHDREDEPVRAALRKQGFDAVACGDRKGKL
jgi:hypothetical protein